MTSRILGPGAVPVVQRRNAPVRRQQPGFDNALERMLREQPQTEAPAAVPGKLQFSRHAMARLESRGVVVDDVEKGRLNDAIDALQKRGAKESLVITPDAAYGVGVPKRTVITAMPKSEALGNIFTQIDSTYISP